MSSSWFTVLAVYCGSANTSILSPAGLVSRIDLLAHWITASHAVNHPVPSITSIPFDSIIIRLARNLCPKSLYWRCHTYRMLSIPPGELTSIWRGNRLMGMLCWATNSEVMKEWDARESNRTEVGTELTRNIPRQLWDSSERLQHQHGSPCHVSSFAVPYRFVESNFHSFRDNPPKKIPYYRLNQSTLSIKQ
jgi:hypothetical protein